MRVQQAEDILQDRLHDVDGVEKWAKLLGYPSAKAFSQDYKRAFHRSPIQALIHAKLYRAVRLLRLAMNLTCFDIAVAIGKKDEKGLNFFFKTHTGQPPRYFRENPDAPLVFKRDRL